MNKTIRLGAAAVAVAAAMGVSSVAQAQTSATADARAEILAALELTQEAVLDFGTIVVPGNADGTVSLAAADGAVSCPANFVCVGTPAAGTFRVNGTGGEIVDVTFPGPIVDLINGNGDELELTGLNTDTPAVALDGSGVGRFNVGGQIFIEQADSAGLYQGNYDVRVDYQ